MKRVGVGVIGFGQRGLSFDALVRNHFQAEAFIVGYHDTDTSRLAAAEKWVKPYNGVAKANLNDFLDILGLDIVFVCTPQFAHADPAIAALEAGKNVFVEKPMATTLEDCDRMLAARERSPGTLFMGFNLRSHALCRKLKELVADGVIGKPQTVVCIDFYAMGGTYFRRWHRFERNSGGLMVEKGSHSIDLINWFVDSKPVAVAGFAGLDAFVPRPEAAEHCRDCKLMGECSYAVNVADLATQVEKTGEDPAALDLCVYNSEKDTCDNHHAVIEYANGCRASYIESFASIVPDRSGRTFILNGTGGQIWAALASLEIHVHKTGSFAQKRRPATVIKFPEIKRHHGGADIEQFRHMLDVLAGQCENRLLPEIGREAVLVALAAEQAAKEHRVVDISRGRLD